MLQGFLSLLAWVFGLALKGWASVLFIPVAFALVAGAAKLILLFRGRDDNSEWNGVVTCLAIAVFVAGLVLIIPVWHWLFNFNLDSEHVRQEKIESWLHIVSLCFVFFMGTVVAVLFTYGNNAPAFFKKHETITAILINLFLWGFLTWLFAD